MRMTVGYFFFGALISALVTGAFAKEMGKAEVSIPRPELPAISAIEVEPARIVLHDARDARRVLIWGKTEGGGKIDLTSDARFECDSEAVAIDGDHYISPKKKGTAEISVRAAGKSTP